MKLPNALVGYLGSRDMDEDLLEGFDLVQMAQTRVGDVRVVGECELDVRQPRFFKLLEPSIGDAGSHQVERTQSLQALEMLQSRVVDRSSNKAQRFEGFALQEMFDSLIPHRRVVEGEPFEVWHRRQVGHTGIGHGSFFENQHAKVFQFLKRFEPLIGDLRFGEVKVFRLASVESGRLLRSG